MMQLSVIIAVYNRSDELTELLQSFCEQTVKPHEIVIVDDGSQEDLQKVVDKFQTKLNLQYHYKSNSGPGLSRNFGAKKATGTYLLFIDSDCIAPKNYIENVQHELATHFVDAFGGADMAHESFNAMQKAISYAMTSVLTTGGIRGKQKAVTKFQPRSFNMGISKKAFESVGGFSEMRIGEDPDLSLSLWENGFTTRFFPSVNVYHKRRSTLKSFAKQVYQFGVARPILNKRHPKYTKWIFWFPSVFLLGLVVSLVLFIISFFFSHSVCILSNQFGSLWLRINLSLNFLYKIPIFFYILYFLAILVHSSLQNRSFTVGLLSVVTSAMQLCNYGYGFLKSFFKINVVEIAPEKAFPTHFYTKM